MGEWFARRVKVCVFWLFTLTVGLRLGNAFCQGPLWYRWFFHGEEGIVQQGVGVRRGPHFWWGLGYRGGGGGIQVRISAFQILYKSFVCNLFGVFKDLWSAVITASACCFS